MTFQTRWLVLFVLSLLPLRVGAEPTEEAERDRARAFLVVRIADALKLSDADALKVSAVIRRSDDRRLALVKQRDSFESALRSALEKTPADPSELTRLIREGNELDQQLAFVPEETFRELQAVLTVEQQAKLLLFRRELQGEVRDALQRHVGGAAGGGRGQPGRKGKRQSSN